MKRERHCFEREPFGKFSLREFGSNVYARRLWLKPAPDAVIVLGFVVADPVSVGSKRELLCSVVILARRNPFRDHESESGLIFPCPTRAEGQPIFVLYCRESVVPIGRGTTGVSSCVKGPLFLQPVLHLHCIYSPLSTSLSC